MNVLYWQRHGKTYVTLGGGTLHGVSRTRPGDKFNRMLGVAVACVKARRNLNDEEQHFARKLVEECPVSCTLELSDAKTGLLVNEIIGFTKACDAVEKTGTALYGIVKYRTLKPSPAILAEQSGIRLLNAWETEAQMEVMYAQAEAG